MLIKQAARRSGSRHAGLRGTLDDRQIDAVIGTCAA